MQRDGSAEQICMLIQAAWMTLILVPGIVQIVADLRLEAAYSVYPGL